MKDPKPFTYRIPTALQGRIEVGSAVLVPFGNRKGVGGVVTGLTEEIKTEFEPKDILEVLSEGVLPSLMKPLLEWVAAYYSAPFSGVWLAAVPKGILKKKRKKKNKSNEPLELPPVLTPDQVKVLGQIEKNSKSLFLLHGVTGSGKTEIYLRAIGENLERGKQAIVLVPEIALTPQTVSRFRARFGERIAVLHSGLSGGERAEEWHRLRSGEADIAVGARSAVFAPLERLGLIIVDEEHESSYKQDSAPRYHARTVALKRASLEGATVILGSATPSLESYEAASRGEFALIELPRRINGRPLPPVEVIDMRQELREGNRNMFSRSLKKAVEGILERGEQAILLMNQRGYSRFVLCRACGQAVRCPRCAVSLTLHKGKSEYLICHYCGTRALSPSICPSCRSPKIRHFGVGTQQLEETCQELFPSARIARLDRDTTSRKGSHAQILDGFRDGESDILIGTQMVAKGLDFPRVSLVGVLAADLALNLPDFRAAERTFQLLTQVAGRAGRSEIPGAVIVQTYSPEHFSVQRAKEHDFEGFYHEEAESRRELSYPPFGKLINVVASGTTLESTQEAAESLAASLQRRGVMALGPAPAPLSLLKGRHRFQLLIKTEELESARQVLRESLSEQSSPKNIRFAVDVEPLNLL